MAAEISEISEVITRQLESLDIYLEAGRQLKRDKTHGIITCARGTSDHAATFFKYLEPVPEKCGRFSDKDRLKSKGIEHFR